MIKLGSRTELVLPREEGLELSVELGPGGSGGHQCDGPFFVGPEGRTCVMKSRRKVFAVLPTMLTLGNRVCGLAASFLPPSSALRLDTDLRRAAGAQAPRRARAGDPRGADYLGWS
ncbi:MAG: hypothetical protein Ct9H300mP1_10370 [Planctomycetaceae bacterium]|nr:MAG: hypothetical protein Ct9H300mP1_10370 [Planctomycetaceae bacterium]